MKYFEINAFFPYCNPEGTRKTCILLNNGTKQYSRYRIREFIPHMLYEIGLDARSLHLWSAQVTIHKNNIPLIIDNLNIFIPIKFATSPHTSQFGYVNLGAIACYCDHEVTLRDQTVLATNSSAKYISQKILDAKLLKYAYVDNKKKFEFMWKTELQDFPKNKS